MPRLRPSYSVFLYLLLTPVAAAFAVVGPDQSTRPVLQVGPVARTCATATASATITRSAAVHAPVSVSLSVSLPRIGSRAPRETIFEHAVATGPVAASATARAASRACAHAATLSTAHRDAVARAHVSALALARYRAGEDAANHLTTLIDRVRPSLVAQERLILTARARAAAADALAIRRPPTLRRAPRRPAYKRPRLPPPPARR